MDIMKDTIFFKKRYFCIFLMIAVAIVACDEDDRYDVVGDTTNRIFVNTQTSYVNNYNFTVAHTPAGSVGDITVKFPVKSTQEVSSDVQVTLAVDNSLVDEYNEENNTAYNYVPQSSINLSVDVLTISEGHMLSADSVMVTVINMDALTEEEYLLPLRVTQISGATGTEISRNLNSVLIKINTLETNVYDKPTNSDMIGELMTDKSAWSATSSVPINNLSRMFDDRTNRYWLSSPQELDFTVDLGEVTSGIAGIRIHSFSTNYSLTQIAVYSSNDGVAWGEQGIANLSTASAHQYIKFYSDVEARYLKLQILGWVSSQYIVISQFDVYRIGD